MNQLQWQGFKSVCGRFKIVDRVGEGWYRLLENGKDTGAASSNVETLKLAAQSLLEKREGVKAK